MNPTPGWILAVGLIVSLAASPLVLMAFRRLHVAAWAPIPRLALWVAAGIAFGAAVIGDPAWRVHLGLIWPTWTGVGWTALAVAVAFAALAGSVRIQRRPGRRPQGGSAPGQALFRLPFGSRCFIVATAAVTEEVLYRGYAVGVGQVLWGSLWVAGAVSVVAFTAAHFRWGGAHLVAVFVSGLVLTVLFVLTGNLWLCMAAHAIVDGVGFLAGPAMTRRRGQPTQQAG